MVVKHGNNRQFNLMAANCLCTCERWSAVLYVVANTIGQCSELAEAVCYLAQSRISHFQSYLGS